MALSNYYYFPHITKENYNRTFNNARKWALENLEERPQDAARIYHVKEDSLQKLVLQLVKKQKNSKREYNTYRGNNKILNEAQEEAICQYYYEQWEISLGASHKIVFAAICHLRQV